MKKKIYLKKMLFGVAMTLFMIFYCTWYLGERIHMGDLLLNFVELNNYLHSDYLYIFLLPLFFNLYLQSYFYKEDKYIYLRTGRKKYIMHCIFEVVAHTFKLFIIHLYLCFLAIILLRERLQYDVALNELILKSSLLLFLGILCYLLFFRMISAFFKETFGAYVLFCVPFVEFGLSKILMINFPFIFSNMGFNHEYMDMYFGRMAFLYFYSLLFVLLFVVRVFKKNFL